MGCSLPGSSVHVILQAGMLQWVVTSSSREPSPPRDRTHVSYVSCFGRRVLYHSHHLGRGVGRPLYKLLKYYSSCTYLRQALYVNSFSYWNCPLPIWSGLPLSCDFLAVCLCGPVLDFTWRTLKVMNKHRYFRWKHIIAHKPHHLQYLIYSYNLMTHKGRVGKT